MTRTHRFALTSALAALVAAPTAQAQNQPPPQRVSFVVPLATSGSAPRVASFDVAAEGATWVLQGCVSRRAGSCRRTVRHVLDAGEVARYVSLWQANQGPRSCSMAALGRMEALLIVRTPGGGEETINVSTSPSLRSAHAQRIGTTPRSDCDSLARLGYWLAALLESP